MAYSADLCGSKLRGKLGAVLNESAATSLLSSNNSFAKRQLEKMGWTEGTGLGKRRDGMKEHIKIKQREDEMGLGREKMKAMEVADVWWKDSVGDTLAKLQKRKSSSTNKDDKKEKKSKKKKKSEKERKRHFTDEELFEATGGARFGMRAQRRAEGKWKRTESGEELLQQEKKARASMEWNGRGNAQVLISKETSRNSSILEDEHDDETDVGTTKNDADVSDASAPEDKTATIKEEKQSKKKKKRKSEKKESKEAKKAKLEEEDGIHEVSPPVSEEEELQEKKSGKKRSKKDKKKKSR